jgi:hypothetical protein
MTERTPTVREVIATAQADLHKLADYVTANHDNLDLLQVQMLASKVLTDLERASAELSYATCDADAALARI